MSLNSDSYGAVEGVAKFVLHATNTAGAFDTTTTPTLAQVEAMLDEQSDVLNGWLAHNNYVIPVTAPRAVRWLARYAQIGAAGLVELAQRSGGYDAEDQNRRENKFLKEFAEAEQMIQDGVLAGLGAATTNAPGALFGLRVGGGTRTGQALQPIFTRTSFGNDPTAERGSKEPGYSGDP